MTREESMEALSVQEVIKVLKKELQIIDDPNVTMTVREWEEHDDHMRDALDMAIEALEQELSCRNPRQVDRISRQAVVNEIHKYFVEEIGKTPTEIDKDGYEIYCDMKKVNMFLSDNKHLSKKIKNLPSVQPERKTDGDTISRQDVMNELKEMQDYISYKIFCAENNPTEYAEDYIRNMEQQSVGIAHAEHRILELPSTQPERKKGKWIIDDKEAGRIWHCHCSNCGEDPQDHIGGTENWWLVRLPKYCPNCGARMESGEQ